MVCLMPSISLQTNLGITKKYAFSWYMDYMRVDCIILTISTKVLYVPSSIKYMFQPEFRPGVTRYCSHEMNGLVLFCFRGDPNPVSGIT